MFDRDEQEQEFSRIIEESLEAILSGQASLGDVLRQHPDRAAALQPELETALWLIARQEQVQPRPGYVSASRLRVVERVRQEGQNRGTRRALLGFLFPQARFTFQWVAALIVLVMLLGSTSGIISISQGALPDEQLYSVKRVSEEVAFGLTWNDVRKVDLRAGYTGRRLDEVEALITHQNYATVSETLNDFEQEVNQSVFLLKEVSEKQSEKKGALASQMQEDFSAYAVRLDALKSNVPDEVRASLDRARDVSMNGASLAIEVLEDIQAKSRATVTPPAPAPSPSLVPSTETATPVPPATEAVETVQPGDTSPPSTDQEEDPGTVEPAPDTEDPIIKTPKPTNENRPTTPADVRKTIEADEPEPDTDITDMSDVPEVPDIPDVVEKPTKEVKDKKDK